MEYLLLLCCKFLRGNKIKMYMNNRKVKYVFVKEIIFQVENKLIC